ncbi:hypothetical protein GCM10010121_081620 [Streptomyces brasiliensis]|uniref:Uncharacterized protein n=1 Tax=Streptomyces brasiliensis TaxID=1954 RepID=A0A917P3D6_9ACTN|nr:hypothetical protein GCM10010121_081620 [Streptomyces brasiliensis]
MPRPHRSLEQTLPAHMLAIIDAASCAPATSSPSSEAPPRPSSALRGGVRRTGRISTRFPRPVPGRGQRLPAEDGEDLEDMGIDPARYTAYDEMRANYGERAMNLVEALAGCAPQEGA